MRCVSTTGTDYRLWCRVIQTRVSEFHFALDLCSELWLLQRHAIPSLILPREDIFLALISRFVQAVDPSMRSQINEDRKPSHNLSEIIREKPRYWTWSLLPDFRCGNRAFWLFHYRKGKHFWCILIVMTPITIKKKNLEWVHSSFRTRTFYQVLKEFWFCKHFSKYTKIAIKIRYLTISP